MHPQHLFANLCLAFCAALSTPATCAQFADPAAGPGAALTAPSGPSTRVATNPLVDGFILPNPNLHADGIPPIAASLAREVGRYGGLRPVAFVAWHPAKREMLVRQRPDNANTVQLHWLKGPGQALQAVTTHPDPVGAATLDAKAQYLVYAASVGGSEADQLYRLDLDPDTGAPQGKPVLLTHERERHARWLWHRRNGQRSGELLVASVSLDRFVPPAERHNMGTTLRLLDPLRPEQAQTLVKLPQTGWSGGSLSRDGNTLYVSKYLSANHSEIWALDLSKPELAAKDPTQVMRRVLPAPGDTSTKAVHVQPRLSADGKHLLLLTDRASEFRELTRLSLATGELQRLTAAWPHDVEGFGSDDEMGSDALDDDGDAQPRSDSDDLLLVRLNVNGRAELRALHAKTFKPVDLLGLPPGNVLTAAPRGRSVDWAIQSNGDHTPGEVWVLNRDELLAASGTASSTNGATSASAQPWAQAGSGALRIKPKPQEVIRWKSFDGLEITGLISRPPERHSGKRPVLIDIHGGPESQARVGYLGRQGYYVQELGITVIRPNVRGSSGFGKTFLTLDNGKLRENSVKDIGALLDWVAQQPDLDASRVLVSGGSYGGYMSLAVAVHYADRIAGAIDSVGISNFVTFLESTESYRRDLRRVEYGDERDLDMRAFLHSISPLTHAHKITKPLFVVQGKNDPRVPVTEAEQIVAKVRANGTPVWYLRGENEGHGFARLENASFLGYAIVAFMRETLLKQQQHMQ